MREYRVLPPLLVSFLGAGCAGGPLSGLLRSPSLSEQYAEQLISAGLAETAMGRAWIRAGQRALAQPVVARLPLRETGYFPADAPGAVGYRLELVRGRIFDVEVRFESTEPTRLFVDLFEIRDTVPRRVASLPLDSTVFRHEVRRDGIYVLRLQPELLRSGRYTIVQRTLAALIFPVPGLGTRSILSGWGAERDAGLRVHEGVDIFAPRGTPVIAVKNGMAYPTLNERGGIVVWLNEDESSRTYYYAHLDQWAFEESREVLVGDTLGFIGNTGNARTTRPHLHFGVYESGAMNPLPFLTPDDAIPPVSPVPLDRLDHWVRVSVARGELRQGPQSAAPPEQELPRGTVAQVTAVAGRALRLRLPDGTAGYVDDVEVTPVTRPLRTERLPSGTLLLESPAPGAPAVLVLEELTVVEVLGRYREYHLVRAGDRVFWHNPTE